MCTQSGGSVFLIIIFLSTGLFTTISANDFPSLLVANATMAVILDHEYLGNEYENILEDVREIVANVLRVELKEGGLTVKYFSWTQINFNKDFTAVMSISTCKNTWRTFLKARQETLLYIALTDTDCPRLPSDEAIMIPILTVGQELPQILLDIRATRAINWKTAVLLYDDIFDRDSVSRVITALSSESANSQSISMSLSMFKINITTEKDQRESLKRTLHNLKNNYIGSNYLVIATDPSAIIDIAGELGMIQSSSQWLFILSNSSEFNMTTLTSYINDGGNILFAVNNTNNQKCLSGKICHFEEAFKMFTLSLAQAIKEEAAVYGQISDEEWEAIRLTKEKKRNGMLEYIKEHLIKSKMCSTCSKWSFQSIETWGLKYVESSDKEKSDQFPLIKHAAFWEPTNGLLLEDALFPHISHGFRNIVLPIVTYNNPPWQIIDYNENGDIVSMKGVVIHILNELSEKLNFTYSITDPLKFINGSLNNDNLNTSRPIGYQSMLNIPPDVLDLLLENKVFIGATGSTINKYYTDKISFTRPISVQAYSLLISRPRELSRLYLFTAPFSVDTWLCLTLTVIVIGPLLFAVNYISPYNEYFHIIRKGGLYKVGNCFWYIYGALLQQGGMYLPKSDSGRIIVGTWWLVVLVVVTTYCGNLVAFLTFPKIETPISNIDQLLKFQSEVSWSITEDTYLEDYLKETEDVKYRQLSDGAVIQKKDSVQVVDQIKMGKHVFIDWKSNLQFIMKREFLKNDRCDFGLGTENILDERIALILPFESPYLNIINKEIYRMLQMGFIQKWLAEYLPTRDRCWNIGQSLEIENHTVNLNDMQGCFLVLLTGSLVSIFLLFGEYALSKRHVWFKNKKVITPFVK